MNIKEVVSKFAVLTALTVVFGGAFVACGGGGGGMGGGAGGGPPAPPPRNVAISCGGGAGEATLTGAGTVIATATLTGNQQSPPVCTGALGAGTVTVNTATGDISGGITTLSGFGNAITAAHIHDAEASNAIIITLAANATSGFDVPPNAKLDLPTHQVDHFNNGSLYFNVHTNANTNGEIRGQIGRSIFTAAMTSAQERLADSAAISSPATGTGMVVLDPSTNNFTASFHVTGLSSTATAAHIHSPAATGSSASPLVTMTETPSGSGTFTATGTLTAPQLSDLRAGNMYFNVHTMNNSGGEIRGQIGRAIRIAETFSGAAQVPSVASSGSGSGFAVLDVATRTFSGSMTINNITPTAVHIHDAPAGASTTNMVVVGFTISGTTSPFSASVTNAVANATPVKEFLDDGTYMNVHTVTNPNGEIRGQLDIP